METWKLPSCCGEIDDRRDDQESVNLAEYEFIFVKLDSLRICILIKSLLRLKPSLTAAPHSAQPDRFSVALLFTISRIKQVSPFSSHNIPQWHHNQDFHLHKHSLQFISEHSMENLQLKWNVVPKCRSNSLSCVGVWSTKAMRQSSTVSSKLIE